MIRKLAVLAFKVAVLAVAVWYIWPKIDLPRLQAALRQTSGLTVFAVFSLSLVQALLASLRWRCIVETTGHRLRVLDGLDAWLAAQCASQVLPAVVGGDAIRVVRVRRYGVPISAGTMSVIMDRFAGFFMLVSLSIVSMPLLAYRSDAHSFPQEIVWVVLVLAVLLIGFGVALRYSPRLPIIRSAAALGPVRDALSRLPTDRRSLAVIALTSLGTNFTVILSAYALGQGINPAIDLLVCIALMPLVILLTSLPISIAGWGVREALMVGLFGLVGIPAADAFAISVQLGIAGLVLGIIGGVSWLAYPLRTPLVHTNASSSSHD